jgi:hypothetical protein
LPFAAEYDLVLNMGPGLKEGGHHRKALDVAAKKKALKKADKEAKVAAGERGQILAKLLKLDPDVDVYLETTDKSRSNPLCRAHFHFEKCPNRRCKLSHDYTIGHAITPAANADNNSGELPALELVPALGPQRSFQKRRAARKPTPGAAGAFEVLPETAVEMIAAFSCSNADIGNMMRACRFLRACLMDCSEVLRRHQMAVAELLQQRNATLLKNAARLRFAISYRDTTTGKDAKGAKKGSKKGGARPTLAYDHENAVVFRSFQGE